MRGCIATAALLATLALAACDNRSNTGYSRGAPGGAPSGDPVLIRMAREAMPLTQGLERCRATYGSYPPNPEATMGCLPRGAPMTRQGRFVRVGEWLISPDKTGAGYTMSRQVDARAMLLRRCVKQSCQWILDPGDGRPSLQMNLGA